MYKKLYQGKEVYKSGNELLRKECEKYIIYPKRKRL